MSQAVHSMFASIARRYDLANDVLSCGIHRLWRKKLLRMSGVRSGATVLDLCTGTGDLAFLFAEAVSPDGSVHALDFVEEMLNLAKEKAANRPSSQLIKFVCADAMKLPYTENYFDIASIAFGIRNLDDPLIGLKEIKRALKIGGRVLVLEFGQPSIPAFRNVYNFYSVTVMPVIGQLLTGNRAAYEYLPETAAKFPAAENFLALMRESGFENCSYKSLLGGIAYIYAGEKSSHNK